MSQPAGLFRKGIVLAGGTGSRLYPLTQSTSKQLLPIAGKPMIFFPISTLMSAGIRQILIITTPEHLAAFQQLLGDGRDLGIEIDYAVQPQPRGLAEALTIGREFIDGCPVALILGDNFFYGEAWAAGMARATHRSTGATIFGYEVSSPENFGVVVVGVDGKPKSLEEKPQRAQSPFAVPGLYFYDSQAADIASNLKPSARGELEITDVNSEYLRRDQLHVELVSSTATWFDLGTHESLLQASRFVEAKQSENHDQIGSLEHCAYKLGLIDAEQLALIVDRRRH